MSTIDLSGLNLPEKEQKILEAAVQVFSEKGFSAATTSEIARNAGVAEGTIFRYFKTKKDILRGILIHTIHLFSESLVISGIEKIIKNRKNKDLRAVLKEIIIDRLMLVDSVFPMARIILTEALYHEDVRQAIYENIVVKAVDVFREFQRQMVENGMMREDIEAEALLRSILGSIFMLIAQRKLFADKLPMEDFEKEMDKTIDVLLYGIVKKQEDFTELGADQ